jgi:phosphatidylglycerophosphate synthase
MPNEFVEAKRQSNGLLTGIERRVLIWIAERLPGRINSDHLTALGLVSMFMVGVSFATRHAVPGALAGVILFLALNWFGDSLDGTVARVRGHQRPRYGFYVDHILDTFGILFVISGLAISGDMTPIIAAAFLVAYYILSIEIFLATYCVGRFQMSFWGFGPTELRILLAVGALMLTVKPVVTVFGARMLLFDVGGIVGVVGLLITAIISAIGNTRRLYEAEPLPGRGTKTGIKHEVRRSGEVFPGKFEQQIMSSGD